MNDKEEYSLFGDHVLDLMTRFAVNRNNWVEEVITGYFNFKESDNELSLLDFGAGRGEFIDRFLKHKNVKTYCVEIDDTYYSNLSINHKAFKSLNNIEKKIDCLYSIDTLEHVENDEAILQEMYEKIASKGKLLIYVPARMELYTDFDKAIGHHRRYRLKELKEKIKKQGFIIDSIHYSDFLGYFAVYFNKLTKGGFSQNKVIAYDKTLIPISKFLEKIIKLPIGKDIIVKARKP